MSKYSKEDRAAVAAMSFKQRAALFERYADLLRTAWLNPSHAPTQAAVHEFEGEHDKQLAPFFRKWRDAFVEKEADDGVVLRGVCVCKGHKHLGGVGGCYFGGTLVPRCTCTWRD